MQTDGKMLLSNGINVGPFEMFNFVCKNACHLHIDKFMRQRSNHHIKKEVCRSTVSLFQKNVCTTQSYKRKKEKNITTYFPFWQQMQKVVFSPSTKPSCRCFGGQVNGTAWPFPPTAACLGMHRRPLLIDEWARGAEIYPQVTVWPW